MKYCKFRNHECTGLNNIITEVHYVLYEDVLSFHGKKFAEQWLKFIENKPTFLLNEQKCYYYADYKQFAITTDMYMNNI